MNVRTTSVEYRKPKLVVFVRFFFPTENRLVFVVFRLGKINLTGKPTRFLSVGFFPVPYPNKAFISLWKPIHFFLIHAPHATQPAHMPIARTQATTRNSITVRIAARHTEAEQWQQASAVAQGTVRRETASDKSGRMQTEVLASSVAALLSHSDSRRLPTV